MIIRNLVLIRDATSLNKSAQIVQKWPKKNSIIAKISWFFASFGVWHAAYVHSQRHVTCPMSQIGSNVITCNLLLLGDANSLRRVLKWVKMGNLDQNGAFWHVLVCCKAYVHPQRNVTHPMSHIGHTVIMCNLEVIGDATSLNTSAKMVQKGPINVNNYEDVMVLCLISGWARSLCSTSTLCNLSNVTNRTQCDNMQLGSF